MNNESTLLAMALAHGFELAVLRAALTRAHILEDVEDKLAEDRFAVAQIFRETFSEMGFSAEMIGEMVMRIERELASVQRWSRVICEAASDPTRGAQP
jgi:hypothetical protein